MPRSASRRRSKRSRRSRKSKRVWRSRKSKTFRYRSLQQVPKLTEKADDDHIVMYVKQNKETSEHRSKRRRCLTYPGNTNTDTVLIVLFNHEKWNLSKVTHKRDGNLVHILTPNHPIFRDTALRAIQPEFRKGCVFDCYGLEKVELHLNSKSAEVQKVCTYEHKVIPRNVSNVKYWFGERTPDCFEFGTTITDIFSELNTDVEETDVLLQTILESLSSEDIKTISVYLQVSDPAKNVWLREWSSSKNAVTISDDYIRNTLQEWAEWLQSSCDSEELPDISEIPLELPELLDVQDALETATEE